MKTYSILILLSSLIGGCNAKSFENSQYTGYEINNNFKKLQEFNVDYEVENGGPILNNHVNVYKIDKNTCLVVANVDGDSGGYGTEDILYLYNLKFISGYSFEYTYTFLNNEGTVKSNRRNYSNIVENKENTEFLREDFIKYYEKLNESTLRNCSDSLKPM